MPHKTKSDRARYQRGYRAKLREAKAPHLAGMTPVVSLPSDPAGEISRWSAETLLVPPGHHRSGSAMEIPDYGVAFLRDVFTHRESLLCLARKNAKSAIVAVLLLAHLGPPHMTTFWNVRSSRLSALSSIASTRHWLT